jgi:hypothetical protein
MSALNLLYVLQFAPWRPDYVQRVYGYKPYEIPFNQISG